MGLNNSTFQLTKFNTCVIEPLSYRYIIINHIPHIAVQDALTSRAIKFLIIALENRTRKYCESDKVKKETEPFSSTSSDLDISSSIIMKTFLCPALIVLLAVVTYISARGDKDVCLDLAEAHPCDGADTSRYHAICNFCHFGYYATCDEGDVRVLSCPHLEDENGVYFRPIFDRLSQQCSRNSTTCTPWFAVRDQFCPNHHKLSRSSLPDISAETPASPGRTVCTEHYSISVRRAFIPFVHHSIACCTTGNSNPSDCFTRGQIITFPYTASRDLIGWLS
ncbi:hypothetical protein RRG08_063706 [Elysia crispata]|uniref:Uncharacterized protein n=1 Tax=Elysia crispata TaxID=231223 RepID=A0AAE1DPD4_9GAST|nr:hypothetical protein RRG08_063706 [Elysia crispata]